MTERAKKRRAGERAASLVESGAVVGLGTGSTAAFAITAFGEAVSDGMSIQGVPTSYQARERAIAAGIPVVDLDMIDRVTVSIDGADQVVGSTAIKGGGAAHTREKLVATAADEFVVVVDEGKLADSITEPIPLAVLPGAESVVNRRIQDLDGAATVRSGSGKDGPVITDNGNVVLDASFDSIDDPRTVARELASIPGVIEHGLFVDMIDRLVVGGDADATVSQP